MFSQSFPFFLYTKATHWSTNNFGYLCNNLLPKQDCYTALHIACSCGHVEIVDELLLAPEIDIWAADKAMM